MTFALSLSRVCAAVVLLVAAAPLAAQSAPPGAAGRSAASGGAAADAGRDADRDADADAAAEDEAEAAPARPAARRARAARGPVWRFGAENVLAEIAATPEHPSVDGLWTLRAAPYAQWQPNRDWELRGGVLLDGTGQTGGADFTRWRADVDDTYVRWRGGDTRLTAGAQTILWGRVDGVPIIDRVSRVDLTRALLDRLPERRRSQWALRWEQNWDDTKLDAVVLPAFVGAELPAVDSVWSPVNRRIGRVFGIAPNPALAALVQTGRIAQDDGGFGGAGLRLTGTAAETDWGLTLSRVRQSLPYYVADFAAGTFTAVHPYATQLAVDAERVVGGATWRTELGVTDGAPLTSLAAERRDARIVEWVGAVEFFVADDAARVNLQLVARHASVDGPVLELKRYAGVNGEVETTFDQGRWKLALQFASGLNVHDVYLSPRLTWVGWEPHEIYVALHHFRGNERTLGGYYDDNDLIAVGWRTRF